MALKDEFKVGQELQVWSNRVFGVPVHFTITRVGTKLLHGEFRRLEPTSALGERSLRVVTWQGSITPERIVHR